MSTAATEAARPATRTPVPPQAQYDAGTRHMRQRHHRTTRLGDGALIAAGEKTHFGREARQ